jgi:hypothetical protein
MKATEIIGAIIGIILGPGFLAYGIWMLRTRAWRDSVPALEVLLDRMIGEEPPARTKTDQRLMHIQAWLLAVVGGFMTAVEIYVLVDQILSE